MADETLSLTVELADGSVKLHGFHLGTDLAVARDLVANDIPKRIAYAGFRTMAIWQGPPQQRSGRIVDVFDGHTWSSDDADWLDVQDD